MLWCTELLPVEGSIFAGSDLFFSFHSYTATHTYQLSISTSLRLASTALISRIVESSFADCWTIYSFFSSIILSWFINIYLCLSRLSGNGSIIFWSPSMTSSSFLISSSKSFSISSFSLIVRRSKSSFSRSSFSIFEIVRSNSEMTSSLASRSCLKSVATFLI